MIRKSLWLLCIALYYVNAADEEILIDYERMNEIEDKCGRKWDVKLKYIDYFDDSAHNQSVMCAVECVLQESNFIDNETNIQTDHVKKALHEAFDASNDIDLRKLIDENVDTCYNEVKTIDNSERCLKTYKFDVCVSVKLEGIGEPEDVLDCYNTWNVRPRDIRYKNEGNESVRCAVECIMKVFNMSDEAGNVDVEFVKTSFINHLELQNEVDMKNALIAGLDKCYNEVTGSGSTEKCYISSKFFFCADDELDKLDDMESKKEQV